MKAATPGPDWLIFRALVKSLVSFSQYPPGVSSGGAITDVFRVLVIYFVSLSPCLPGVSSGEAIPDILRICHSVYALQHFFPVRTGLCWGWLFSRRVLQGFCDIVSEHVTLSRE